MIAKIKGILSEIIDDHHVLIEVSGIYYEVMLPAVVMKELRDRFSIGDEVILSTLHEIENSGGFANMTPRLVGFLTDREKKFFERIVKVKDFGAKRAMKALIVPFDQVASAIERADIAFLTTLPEIGKRSAEKIVAELKGKMTMFLPEDDTSHTMEDDHSMPDFKREAIAALVQLGYKRPEAQRMVNRAMMRNPEITRTDDLIKEVFHQPD